MPEYRLGRLKDRWVVTWWADGKRHRYRLDATTRAAAERGLADFTRGLAVAAAPTVETLWSSYRKEKEGRRVAAAMKSEWKALGPHFGHLAPEHVTIALCRSYAVQRRRKGIHDGTIWTELGHLRTVLKWAADNRMIAHAPKIERPSKPKPKDRYLTLAEIDRLLAAATVPHIKLAILLMLATAARVGAILDLTWDRVDMERGVIRLAREDATTRKGRATVPINAGLRAALSEARRGALTDYVIEWAGEAPVASIKTGFYAAAAKAKLPGVSPHVLRHTAAVHMAEAGISMDEIAQYLGHEDSRITSRVYARFSPDHLRKAADVLDFTRVRAAAPN